MERLLTGKVEVALVPSLIALTNPDEFDVLPAAALSTWSNPFSRLLLRHGLQQVETVAYDQLYPQEAAVARIILKEHYSQEPEFLALADTSIADLEGALTDASLLVGNEVPLLQPEALTLDIGEEWYELANYPMVWGLFAMRKGEVDVRAVYALQEMVKAAEQQRSVWLQAQEMPPYIHAFFIEGLRVRFDDLALASLTELNQYLYYYNITEELRELPLFELPFEDEGDEPRPML